jgi:hypothetical protein
VAGVCGVLILIRAVLFLREGYKPITSTEVEQPGEMTQGKEKDSSENQQQKYIKLATKLAKAKTYDCR